MLTFTFGDVFLANGNGQYAATMTGAFVADDGFLLDYTADANCTSLDMTAVTELPIALPWSETNRIIYLSEATATEGCNLVIGDVCQQLVLSSVGGDFRPAKSFTATSATFICEVDGYRLLMLPFTADVPQGAKAYAITSDICVTEELTTIPAHQPVLVEAQGEIIFTGAGEVSYYTSGLTDFLRGTYVRKNIYPSDYLLGCQNGEWGLVRQTTSSELMPFDVYAQPSSTASFLPLDFSVMGIDKKTFTPILRDMPIFNVMGQRVDDNYKGIVIINGKKVIRK